MDLQNLAKNLIKALKELEDPQISAKEREQNFDHLLQVFKIRLPLDEKYCQKIILIYITTLIEKKLKESELMVIFQSFQQFILVYQEIIKKIFHKQELNNYLALLISQLIEQYENQCKQISIFSLEISQILLNLIKKEQLKQFFPFLCSKLFENLISIKGSKKQTKMLVKLIELCMIKIFSGLNKKPNEFQINNLKNLLFHIKPTQIDDFDQSEKHIENYLYQVRSSSLNHEKVAESFCKIFNECQNFFKDSCLICMIEIIFQNDEQMTYSKQIKFTKISSQMQELLQQRFLMSLSRLIQLKAEINSQKFSQIIRVSQNYLILFDNNIEFSYDQLNTISIILQKVFELQSNLFIQLNNEDFIGYISPLQQNKCIDQQQIHFYNDQCKQIKLKLITNNLQLCNYDQTVLQQLLALLKQFPQSFKIQIFDIIQDKIYTLIQFNKFNDIVNLLLVLDEFNIENEKFISILQTVDQEFNETQTENYIIFQLIYIQNTLNPKSNYQENLDTLVQLFYKADQFKEIFQIKMQCEKQIALMVQNTSQNNVQQLLQYFGFNITQRIISLLKIKAKYVFNVIKTFFLLIKEQIDFSILIIQLIQEYDRYYLKADFKIISMFLSTFKGMIEKLQYLENNDKKTTYLRQILLRLKPLILNKNKQIFNQTIQVLEVSLIHLNKQKMDIDQAKMNFSTDDPVNTSIPDSLPVVLNEFYDTLIFSIQQNDQKQSVVLNFFIKICSFNDTFLCTNQRLIGKLLPLIKIHTQSLSKDCNQLDKLKIILLFVDLLQAINQNYYKDELKKIIDQELSMFMSQIQKKTRPNSNFSKLSDQIYQKYHALQIL